MRTFALPAHPDGREALHRLRDRIASVANDHGYDRDDAYAITLVASELATNAMRYGNGGLVHWYVDGGTFVLCVLNRIDDADGLLVARRAATVHTNVAVATKRLPGHPAPAQAGRAGHVQRLVRAAAAARLDHGRAARLVDSLDELLAWAPDADRFPIEEERTVRISARPDEVLLLVTAPLRSTAASLDGEGGCGRPLTEALMDSSHVGVLAVARQLEEQS